MPTSQNMGTQFVGYFAGKVVDVDDPLKLGRVRVQIYGTHDDPEEVTGTFDLPYNLEDLKWSSVLMPALAPMIQQVGITPVGLAVGSIVVGLYLDGSTDRQMTLVLGVLPVLPGSNFANHSVPNRGRGSNDINKGQIGPEPKDPYQGEYPFVQAIRTSSGHLIEVDDSPGAERIHLYHKSGSYIELQPNGNVVIKATGDVYNVGTKKQTLYADGDITIKTRAKTTIDCKGDAVIKAKNITVSGTSLTLNGTASVDITSGGIVNILAPSVNIS